MSQYSEQVDRMGRKLKESIIARNNKGQSVEQIAEETDCSRRVVELVLASQEPTLNTPDRHGGQESSNAPRPGRLPTPTKPQSKRSATASQRTSEKSGPGKQDKSSRLQSSGYDLTDVKRLANGRMGVAMATPGKDLLEALEGHRQHEDEIGTQLDVVAYLATDDNTVSERVLAAVDALADVIGYRGPCDVYTSRGSVFRRSRAFLRRGADAADLWARLVKVERALELAYLDNRQAEVDSVEAGAVRGLVESLKDVPYACIRVGSILLIKFEEARGPFLVVRTLSPLEVHALERFPEIQGNPRTALEALATAVATLQSVDSQRETLT